MNDDDPGHRAPGSASFAPTTSRPDHGSPAPAGALGRLLEAERAILERIERAREEAAQSVAEARAEAEAARGRLAEELVEARRELRLKVESEHELELSRIRERAQIEVGKLELCDDARIATAASGLVDALLGDEKATR